jgi:hypothetical protein
LSLCSCRHESDESVTNGALHGVFGSTVESDAVNHCADDDASPHKLAYRVANVLIVPAKAIDPTHDQRVTVAEQVEQSATLRPLREFGADAGDAFIPDDLIKLEAGLLRLSALVLDSLFARADTGVQNGWHSRRSFQGSQPHATCLPRSA